MLSAVTADEEKEAEAEKGVVTLAPSAGEVNVMVEASKTKASLADVIKPGSGSKET